MATILDSLKGVSAYPIPLRTLVDTAEARGLYPSDFVEDDVLKSREYRLAVADLLLWLSLAPNVSQGGQNYSFSEEQRANLRKQASAVYEELEEPDATAKTTFGYKGSRL